MENKDNLIGVIETLFRHKGLLMKVCGMVFLLSIVISLLLPVYYESTSVFYAASTDLSNPDKMFGTGQTESRYYGTSEDIDRIMTIAQGGEVAEFLIKEFDLYEHYEIDRTSKRAAFNIREHMNGLYNVKKTKFDAIELSIEDKDPELAAEIANAARMKIEDISARLIKESQGQQVNAFNASIKESESALKIIGDSLTSLRSKYGIFDPETQGETISSLLASAQMQKSKLEGKIESYKNTKGIPRDSIRKATVELSGTLAQLEALDVNMKLFNEGSSVVVSLSDQHKTARNQLNWDKERKKHIEAAYNAKSPSIHLVEKAEPPVVKSRPVRSIIVLASTFISLLAMLIGILLFENYKEVDWKRVVSGEASKNGVKTDNKKVIA